MSVDKLVDSAQLDSDLTSVANAIRTKGGTSASLAFPAGFVSAINAIPSGGGGSWSWMGNNAVKESTLYGEKVYLKDSPFATWTPTTTATTLVASQSLGAQAMDIDAYDYIILYKFHSHFEYGAGATGKNQVTDVYNEAAHNCFGYFSNYSALANNEPNAMNYASNSMRMATCYLNSSGVASMTTGGYGIYANAIPNASQSGTSFNVSTFQINARCNNTYFSTANAAAVDQAASFYEVSIEKWRVDRWTSLFGGASGLIHDMWLNGF